MASLEIISSNCQFAKCDARATRRLRDKDGNDRGEFCARHGNTELVNLAKDEGSKGRSK